MFYSYICIKAKIYQVLLSIIFYLFLQKFSSEGCELSIEKRRPNQFKLSGCLDVRQVEVDFETKNKHQIANLSKSIKVSDFS